MWREKIFARLSKAKAFIIAIYKIFIVLHEALYNLVLAFFKNKNHKVNSKLADWYMKKETSEHFRLLRMVFIWMVVPASLFYVVASIWYLGQNTIDSMLWGLIVFIYSNFLPDLPSIYRKSKHSNKTKNLQWYENLVLLYFAPIFIWLMFSGIKLKWNTTETFHDFKSAALYGVFLVLFGFLLFGDFPFSIGRITEILSLSLYGIAGYLTHLKVDKVW
jgi:hypothetical protein